MTWIQEWSDVLFIHFPVEADELQRHLPPGIEVDTFEGQAWLGYIFFRLKVRPAWLPVIPGFSSLLELNVRTYVRCAGQPGIYFLRMYADNYLAIAASRLLTPLGYEKATMIDDTSPDGTRHIECRPMPAGTGQLRIDVAMQDRNIEPHPDSLDAWLLERYRLFVSTKNGGILAADAEHPPWRASPGLATHFDDTLGRALGLNSDATPLIHHSPGVAARFHAFRPVLLPTDRRTRAQAVAVAG